MCNSEKEKRNDKNITIIRINNEKEFEEFKAVYQSGYGIGLTRGIKFGIIFGWISFKIIESLIRFIFSLI